MTSTAKAHEPTMEEILASIRRIIADDDPASAEPAAKPKAVEPAAAAPRLKTVEPAPPPIPAAAADEDDAGLNQGDIDAMFASFDAPAPKAEPVAKAEPAPAANADDDLAAAWAAEAGEDEDDVLELTQVAAMTPPPAAQPAFDTQDDDDVGFTDPEPAPQRAESPPPLTAAARAAQSQRPQPEPISLLDAETESLIGRDAGEAVSAAFGSLSNTILSQNARTLDELVQEMLRPMLKNWLDDNLPQIVERLVRAEIERVSRGRR
jgi:uncharacterized protein